MNGATRAPRLVFCGIEGRGLFEAAAGGLAPEIGLALSERAVFDPRVALQSGSGGPLAAAESLDRALVCWLEQRGQRERTLVAVGWDAPGRELAWARAHLPGFARYLHVHAVDLNALAYLLGGTCDYLDALVHAGGWKRMARKAASSVIYYTHGRQPFADDAADGALQALLAFGWMRDVVRGARRSEIDSGDLLSLSERSLETVDADSATWP